MWNKEQCSGSWIIEPIVYLANMLYYKYLVFFLVNATVILLRIASIMTSTLVDTKEAIIALLDAVEACPIQPTSLFLDLEGKDLSRHGSIAILQLLLPPTSVYIIDVHVLQQDAFQTPNSKGTTLATLLEAEHIPKIFFDVRHDSDALYAHFQIKLAGVKDLQVMEFATRRVPGRFLTGLSKCIQLDVGLSHTDMQNWQNVKTAGTKLFSPDQGGGYEVFFTRPLSKEVLEYCIQDVTLLPELLKKYTAKMTSANAAKIKAETLSRIRKSQAASYDGTRKHMAVGPWEPPKKFFPRSAFSDFDD